MSLSLNGGALPIVSLKPLNKQKLRENDRSCNRDGTLSVISACRLLIDCMGLSCFISAVTSRATGPGKFPFVSCFRQVLEYLERLHSLAGTSLVVTTQGSGRKYSRMAEGMLRWVTTFWFSSQVGTGSSPLAGDAVCPG